MDWVAMYKTVPLIITGNWEWGRRDAAGFGYLKLKVCQMV